MQHHLHHAQMLLEIPVLLVTSVRAVADDRMQDMRHVFAKLVYASGGGI